MILDIDFLKTNCQRLYFFGLGFIQVKLNESERVHFYTNAFRKTVLKEEIHNHRYNFESKIIKGTVVQEIYLHQLNSEANSLTTKQELFANHLNDNCKFCITKETCNPVIKKEFDRQECTVKLIQRHTFVTGSSYWTDHDTLHRVDSDDAITYLTRGPYMKDEADVIYPIDLVPTCPFSVKVSDDELWEVIRSMIGK
jgi:hypothetical protein